MQSALDLDSTVVRRANNFRSEDWDDLCERLPKGSYRVAPSFKQSDSRSPVENNGFDRNRLQDELMLKFSCGAALNNSSDWKRVQFLPSGHNVTSSMTLYWPQRRNWKRLRQPKRKESLRVATRRS